MREQAVETAPDELKLAVRLRGQERLRRQTPGYQPYIGDFS